MLRAEGLTRSFGGLKAVSDVSLAVARGEIHAVIGPNGAGKSTLVNLLAGDIPPSGGRVFLGPRDVTRLPPDRRAMAGLGRSFQKTTIFRPMSVFENVRLAAQAHSGRPWRPFGRADRDAAVIRETKVALAAAGITALAAEPAAAISHGEQRQLEIAMMLATRSAVILLDEPLAGMGQAEALRMIELIRSLKAGRAVLIIEHDIDAVFALADQLTVMADGRVIASGTPEAVRRDPLVREAYLGEEHAA